ncbi:MAG: tetratricopeptide repeat protein [Myxococcota bacterium]|nr:tetratricopeptide repeat protein [Myxococcota bacterium]
MQVARTVPFLLVLALGCATPADPPASTAEPRGWQEHFHAALAAGDDERALAIALRQANKADPDGIFLAAQMYQEGRIGPPDYDEAFRLFSHAANLGHAGSMGQLGVHYGRGWGTAPDGEKAVYWYRRAAEEGVAQAQFNLGVRLMTGNGVARDDAEARVWYERAILQGHVEAMTNMAFLLSEGRGGPIDRATALRLLALAEKQGDTTAAAMRTKVLWQDGQQAAVLAQAEEQARNGDFHELYLVSTLQQADGDLQAARHNLQRAAEGGDPNAQFVLGRALLRGIDGPSDPVAGVAWLERAVAAGSEEAIPTLVNARARGLAGDADVVSAVALLRNSAESGSAVAQATLAEAYQKGHLVPKDLNEAEYWARRSAAQRNGRGEYRLASLLWASKDKSKRREAIGYFQRAHLHGEPSATHRLGILTRAGNGVPRDPQRAIQLFEQAASQGEAAALSSYADGITEGFLPGTLEKRNALLEEAMAAGESNAFQSMGEVYRRGSGVPVDEEKAREYWRRGAELGNPIAMYSLGFSLLGAMVPGKAIDIEEGAEWVERAAGYGLPHASVTLCNLYYLGQGVPQSFGRAKQLCAAGRDAGHPNGAPMLEHILAEERNRRAQGLPIPP